MIRLDRHDLPSLASFVSWFPGVQSTPAVASIYSKVFYINAFRSSRLRRLVLLALLSASVSDTFHHVLHTNASCPAGLQLSRRCW